MGKEHQRQQDCQGHAESGEGRSNVSQTPDGLEEQAAAEAFCRAEDDGEQRALMHQVAICGGFRRYRSTALCSSAKWTGLADKSSNILDHRL